MLLQLLSARLTGRGGRLRLRFEITKRLLEQRGGRPVVLGFGPARVHRNVGRNVLLLTGFARLLFFVFGGGRVRVARVALHVSELAFVAVRVHVTVLAPDHAVRASGLLFETTVVRLVTERERTVVVQLVEISDRLRCRFLLLLLRLFLLLDSLLDELLSLRRLGSQAGFRRLLSDDHLRLLFSVFVVVGDLLLFAGPLLQHPRRLPDHDHRLSFGFDVHLLSLLQRPARDQHRLELLLLHLIVRGALSSVVSFDVVRHLFHVHSSTINIRRQQRYQ